MKKYKADITATCLMTVEVWAKSEDEARRHLEESEWALTHESDIGIDSHDILSIKEEASLSDEAMCFIEKLTKRHLQELREDDNDDLVDELREAGLLHTPPSGITRLATEGIFIHEDSQKEDNDGT